MAILFVLNLTVAVGTLNGIIFYANIVAANSKILLPFSEPNFVTVFIAWLNMEFGLDACFFEGMDVYWKTWLQIAFPAYVIFLVVTIIVISEHSLKFAHLIGKRNPMAILTTLIFLSYAKFLHATIAALSSATLNYPDGSHPIMWLPDATVHYLSGKHIVLFTASVLILVLGLSFTALLFSWQWLLRHQDRTVLKWVGNQKLCQLLEPYHAPCTFNHRYWTGLLLLVRVVLYTISAINVSGDPRVALVSTICLVGFLPLLKGFLAIRVYRKTPIDLLETFTHFNLLVLSVFSWYCLETDPRTRQMVAYVSVSVTFLLLVVVCIYHAYEYTGAWSKLKESSCFKTLLAKLLLRTEKQPIALAKGDNLPDCGKTLNHKAKPTYTVVEIHVPQLQQPGSQTVEFNKDQLIPNLKPNVALFYSQTIDENIPYSNPHSSELVDEASSTDHSICATQTHTTETNTIKESKGRNSTEEDSATAGSSI